MNFARTVFYLCTSFQSYADIRDQPVTRSVKYLVKLMMLLALALVVGLIPWAIAGANEFIRRFDQDRPDFRLRDGQITTSVQQPYTWGDNNLRFVLDTTGKVTQPDPTARYGFLFLTDRFVFWAKSTNTADAAIHSQERPLIWFPDGTVDGSYLRQLVRSCLWTGTPVIWLLAVLGGTLTCLLQAYLFSLAASFLERNMPSPMYANQLLNIAIHAVTPAAILVTAYSIMRLEGMDLWLVYLIAYGVFLIGAANACRDRTPTEDTHEDDSWM